MKFLLKLLPILFLAACASVGASQPAKAQPCQWQYQFIAGVATATYCGNATVAGTLNPGQIINAAASIAALRLLSPLVSPQVLVNTYAADRPYGGGIFTADGNLTCTDDGGVEIQAVGGCFHRLTNGLPYNVLWFGAYGDWNKTAGTGHDDTAAIQATFTAAAGGSVTSCGGTTSGNVCTGTIIPASPLGYDGTEYYGYHTTSRLVYVGPTLDMQPNAVIYPTGTGYTALLFFNNPFTKGITNVNLDGPGHGTSSIIDLLVCGTATGQYSAPYASGTLCENVNFGTIQAADTDGSNVSLSGYNNASALNIQDRAGGSTTHPAVNLDWWCAIYSGCPSPAFSVNLKVDSDGDYGIAFYSNPNAQACSVQLHSEVVTGSAGTPSWQLGSCNHHDGRLECANTSCELDMTGATMTNMVEDQTNGYQSLVVGSQGIALVNTTGQFIGDKSGATGAVTFTGGAFSGGSGNNAQFTGGTAKAVGTTFGAIGTLTASPAAGNLAFSCYGCIIGATNTNASFIALSKN